MRNVFKQTKKAGWIRSVPIIMVIIILLFTILSSLGCSGGNPQTEVNVVSPKQTQPDSTKDQAPNNKEKLLSGSQEPKYLDALSQQIAQWSTIVDSLGKLIENPIVEDKAWSTQVKAELDAMRKVAKDASKLSAPEGYEDVHGLYMRAVEDYSWVADNLGKAVDSLDVGLLTQCNERMNSGTDRIDEMRKLIDNRANSNQ
ncbi:MAG: hypothetical protein K6T91_05970 [Firmicutes bacterium]|nr:hypothetical protein [Bacillota bacterium]